MTEDALPALVVPIARKLGGPSAEQHAKAYYADLKEGHYAEAVSDALKSNVDIAVNAANAIAAGWHAIGNEISHVTSHDKPASTPPVDKGAAQAVKK
jgi:hypothetical protein